MYANTITQSDNNTTSMLIVIIKEYRRPWSFNYCHYNYL